MGNRNNGDTMSVTWGSLNPHHVTAQPSDELLFRSCWSQACAELGASVHSGVEFLRMVHERAEQLRRERISK
jgi:hypothetical protein